MSKKEDGKKWLVAEYMRTWDLPYARRLERRGWVMKHFERWISMFDVLEDEQKEMRELFARGDRRVKRHVLDKPFKRTTKRLKFGDSLENR